jgi:hypothetical protein
MKRKIGAGVAAVAVMAALAAYAKSVSVETPTNVLVPGYPVDLGTDVVGNLPVTSLNGGQGASAATFWRGDGTWAATPAASSVGLAAPAWLTVTGSPVTGSGTITLSGTSEPANQVLASPIGAAGPLAPRALVGADLPQPSASALGGVESFAAVPHQWVNAISTAGAPSAAQPSFADLSGQATLSQLPALPANQLLGTTSASTAAGVSVPNCSGAQNALTWASGSGFGCNSLAGTVSSIALSAPSWLTVGGSPITGAGTLSLTGAPQSANQVLASPNGAAGPLAPRALVPADLPPGTASLTAVDQVLSGGANVVAYNVGTEASGTYTVDCGKSPLQYLTNGGAFTLQAPANDGDCHILVTNNGNAGAITFASFRVGANTGDPLTTTNGSMFKIAIDRTNGIASYSVQALQ